MAFPDYSTLLDNFNGTDANPIPNWTTVSGLNDCQRASNIMKGTNSWAGAYRGSYINPEIQFKIGNVDRALICSYRYQDAGAASPIRDSRRRGYQFEFAADGTTYKLTRMDDGASGATLIAVTSWAGGAISIGDRIGIDVDGSSHVLYVARGAGAFVQEASVTDGTYTGAGAVMFQFPSGTDGGVDDLYVAEQITLDQCLPDADVVTTGWTTAPLYSKVNDSSDATVIQATAV